MSQNKKKSGGDLLSVISYVFFGVAAIALVLYILLGVNAKKIRVGENVKKEKPAAEAAVDAPQGDEAAEEQAVQNAENAEAGDAAPADAPQEEAQPEPETPEETTEPFPKELTDIHTLSAGAVEEIYNNYSDKVNNFMVSLTPYESDANNRPTPANNLAQEFSNAGVPATVFCADANTPQASFVFFCNAEGGYTEDLLDVLKDKGVKAVFFIDHSYASHNSAIVKRMIREGHEIGNYSYTCPSGGIASATLEDQMNDAINLQNYVYLAFNYTMQKYCFNDNAWSMQGVKTISDMGYQVVFPSINYEDADPELQYDAKNALEGLEKNLHNGCIYGLHVVNKVTLDVLPNLIDFCKEQGFTLKQLQ